MKSAKCFKSDVCHTENCTYARTRHRIQSGVWNGPLVGYHEDQPYTIREAIGFWYENVSDDQGSVFFRDKCSGLHCSKVCPEQIVLEVDGKENAWSVGARITVAAAVLLIALVCFTMKVNYLLPLLYTYTIYYHSLMLVLRR